jgi:hypothetical protein
MFVYATKSLASERTDRTAIIFTVSGTDFYSAIQLPSLRFFNPPACQRIPDSGASKDLHNQDFHQCLKQQGLDAPER